MTTFVVESISCNTCLQSLDLSELEHHIKEEFHITRKNEIEGELMKLQNYENAAEHEGVIDFWRKSI